MQTECPTIQEIAGRKSNAGEIRRCLTIVHEPGEVFEVRVLGVTPSRGGRKYNAAGWFNDFDAAVREIEIWEALQPAGTYHTINPVHAGCMSRSPNKIAAYQEPTTSDRDILRRRWVYIDIDPIRPTGISSTTDELLDALACAERIRGWMAARGHSEPIFACSGNGAHLLYHFDSPNDAGSTQKVQRILKAIAKQFTNDWCSVDLAVFNAARIARVWGTTARKGANTADRPHRASSVIDVPAALEPQK